MAKIDQFHQGENEVLPSKETHPKKASSGRMHLMAGLLALGIGAVDNVAHAQATTYNEQSPSFARLSSSVESPMDDLDELEQNRMQVSQEALYRFYLNPSVWTHLKNRKLLERVDTMLEAAMGSPDALWYKEELGGIEIRRRPQIKSDIDPNLRIRIENGQVTRVNDIKIDSAFFAEWPVYESIILEVTRKWVAGRGLGVTPEDERKFEAFSMIFPRRLQKLLKIRNSKIPFSTRENPDSEGNDPLAELSEKLESSPASLVEMNDPESDKIQSVYAMTSEENSGVIELRKNRAEGLGVIIGVSREGYLMNYDSANDSWSMPNDYKDAVKRQYQAKLAKRKGVK